MTSSLTITYTESMTLALLDAGGRKPVPGFVEGAAAAGLASAAGLAAAGAAWARTSPVARAHSSAAASLIW
jgi:hypothetical protein